MLRSRGSPLADWMGPVKRSSRRSAGRSLQSCPLGGDFRYCDITVLEGVTTLNIRIVSHTRYGYATLIRFVYVRMHPFCE